MEGLGVEINPTKGFTSDPMKDLHISEYLKGLYVFGDNCSSLSLNLCQVAGKSPSSFICLYEAFVERGVSDEVIRSIAMSYWGDSSFKTGSFAGFRKSEFTLDLFFCFRDYITLSCDANLDSNVLLHIKKGGLDLRKEIPKIEFYTKLMEFLREDLVEDILKEFPGFSDHSIDENLEIQDFLKTVCEVTGHDLNLFIMSDQVLPRGERANRLLREILPRYKSLEDPDSLEFSDADFIEFDMSLFEISVEDLNPESKLLIQDIKFLRDTSLDTYGTTQTLSTKEREKRSQNFCAIYMKLFRFYLEGSE